MTGRSPVGRTGSAWVVRGSRGVRRDQDRSSGGVGVGRSRFGRIVCSGGDAVRRLAVPRKLAYARSRADVLDSSLERVFDVGTRSYGTRTSRRTRVLSTSRGPRRDQVRGHAHRCRVRPPRPFDPRRHAHRPEIAERFGVPRATVERAVDRAGRTIRRPAEFRSLQALAAHFHPTLVAVAWGEPRTLGAR